MNKNVVVAAISVAFALVGTGVQAFEVHFDFTGSDICDSKTTNSLSTADCVDNTYLNFISGAYTLTTSAQAAGAGRLLLGENIAGIGVRSGETDSLLNDNAIWDYDLTDDDDRLQEGFLFSLAGPTNLELVGISFAAFAGQSYDVGGTLRSCASVLTPACIVSFSLNGTDFADQALDSNMWQAPSGFLLTVGGSELSLLALSGWEGARVQEMWFRSVPEPGALTLLGIGLLALGFLWRRKVVRA